MTVESDGDYRVKKVRSKEAVDPDDLETLEDLVVVAINDALGESDRRRKSEWRR